MAAAASRGLSIWSILIFPALFTVGMSLIDTTDGILMLGAYGWAYVKPIRKLYYNLTVTAVSGSQKFANGIAVEIRGDLWAYPVPEQLYIRTEIDLDTGKYAV